MMTATECPTPRDLKALTLGQLSDEDSDQLFQHLSGCETCSSELETVEDTEDSLIASLRTPDDNEEFTGEPDCGLAVAKALGTLALVDVPDQTTEPQNLPSSIGEYEIVRPIGHGGMGSVYLARHTKLGREVALKVLATHRLADARVRERFEAEMLAVGRLSHPNIVTAHDARDVNGTAVLVTEFVSGMDLGQLLLRCGPLSMANACEIVRYIAVALSYTHQQGFIHRDIKPSNVMLSGDGEVKLLDLGLARLQYGERSGDISGAEMTATGQAMGTADYVAPEQVADSKTVDIRADIYALGCTLFKLLTGRAPFADDQHTTAFAKMTAHVSKTPPSLSDVLNDAPRGVVKLVDSMLAKDPSERPQTPASVADAIAPFCKGHALAELSRAAAELEPKPMATATSTSSIGPKTHSWMRRKVPIYAAIAASLFGVAFGVALSIILIITNPDGTKSILQLAEGSRVEIKEDDPSEHVLADPVEVKTDAGSKPALTAPSLLSFGILVNPKSTGRSPLIDRVALEAATQLLHASDGSAPVQTEYGTWVELADDEQAAPLKVQNAGKSFALVSKAQVITWPEIRGHILSTQSKSENRSGAMLTAELDEELGAKFKILTGQNLRNQLAIIVNGSIRVAPTINSEIGEKIAITGAFTSSEIRQIQQWLHGDLVYPVQPKTSSASKSAPQTQETLLEVYDLSESHVPPRFVYRILANRLAGNPDVQIELGEGSAKLLIQANSGKHAWIESVLKGLDSLSSEPRLNSGDDSPKLARAQQNLQRTASAMLYFEAAFKTYPGSVNFLEGGSLQDFYPFSWRVAILPLIGQTELYKAYHFDEPWDSENNLKLLSKMPAIYRSPYANDDQKPGESNLVGFAGEHAALGLSGGHAIASFTDGTSNTILLVESKSTVPWTKPQDINGDAAQAEFFEDHPLTFVMADGLVQSMEKVDLEKLDIMISRDGGDIVER
ncbi:MAG: hypothetical protein Aurels2KO_11970 [Aureliella sp.]